MTTDQLRDNNEDSVYENKDTNIGISDFSSQNLHEEENRVYREWMKETFLNRALPFGVAAIGAVIIRDVFIKPVPLSRTIPKMIVANFLGYAFAFATYSKVLRDRLLALPNLDEKLSSNFDGNP